MKYSDITQKLYESSVLPIKKLKKVFHVGDIDIDKKRQNSHEGDGLSVSTHPEAWRAINRGRTVGDTWELSKNNGQFLDVHSIKKFQKQEIINWGLQNGYIEEDVRFCVSFFDDDLDSEVSYCFDSEEEAISEYPEEDISVEKNAIKPTNKLISRTKNSQKEFALDMLYVIYAEDVLNLDGVWWGDKLDVGKYSAPRGVIFNKNLPSWNKLVLK